MVIMLLWLMVFVLTPSLTAKPVSDYEHCEYGITPAEIESKTNELLSSTFAIYWYSNGTAEIIQQGKAKKPR